MPRLVLLNGPPGSGKSTVAERLAQELDGVTALDVDVVKHALPAWPDDPSSAGLQAREIVLDRARTLLRTGRDVVVGQFLARPPFIDQLAGLAQAEEARFVEVVLLVDECTLARRLAGRQQRPERPEHAVNNLLVGPEDAPALVAGMQSLLRTRPRARVVEASGTVEATVATVREVIGAR